MQLIKYFFLLLLLFETMSINPYQVLGISRKSTPAIINQALRKMVAIYKDDSKILTLLKEAYG